MKLKKYYSLVFDGGHDSTFGSVNDENRRTVQEQVGEALGFTWQQAGFSLAVTLALWGLSVWQHRENWFALYALMFFPVTASCLIILASQKWFALCRSWTAVWVLLIVLVLSSSCAATALYWTWTKEWHWVRPSMVTCLLLTLVFSFLGLGLPLWKMQMQTRAYQIANLKSAILSAELKALQAQIEPHFLYNTLSNARYLARHDAEKAVFMLDHLISYLQCLLPDLRSQTASLEREFELAGHYLALMSLRFGDRLEYQIHLPEELKAVQIAPMMLMTLVENAVQHGVEPTPGQVAVRLIAERRHGKLRILVTDSGAGLGQKILGTGVGLRNLRDRLCAMYGKAADLSLHRLDAQVTVAELTLPMTELQVTA